MKTQGNIILITGATSGLGRAFAEEFHKRGNTVIICGRREDRLRQITASHPGMISYKCDISQDIERRELFEWIRKEHPATNVLINNAGVQYAFDLQQELDMQKMHNEIETNFSAPIHLSSLFASFLAKKEHAAIINISSGLAFAPIAFMPVYCATKAAIHSFTLSLRHQLRNTSIKVFEIAPPAVDTELGHDRRTDKSQSHGGISIDEFLKEAMEAIEQDKLEAPIANAKNIKANAEKMFEVMNK